jgi:Peptidase S24-like
MRVSETRVRRDSRLFEELCSALLRRGNAVQFRAHGQSMSPNLQDGDNVVVAPVNQTELRPGDVVLAENTDGLRVHRLHSVDKVSGHAVLRSDTAHEFDASSSHVYGKVVARHNGEGREDFNSFQTRCGQESASSRGNHTFRCFRFFGLCQPARPVCRGTIPDDYKYALGNYGSARRHNHLYPGRHQSEFLRRNPPTDLDPTFAGEYHLRFCHKNRRNWCLDLRKYPSYHLFAERREYF